MKTILKQKVVLPIYFYVNINKDTAERIKYKYNVKSESAGKFNIKAGTTETILQ